MRTASYKRQAGSFKRHMTLASLTSISFHSVMCCHAHFLVCMYMMYMLHYIARLINLPATYLEHGINSCTFAVLNA